MAKVPGLKLRGNTYIFRKRVPLDLVKVIGKTEDKCSLETTDHKTAVRRAHRRASDLLETWENLRRAIKRGEKVVANGDVSDGAMRQAVVGDFWSHEQRTTELPDDDDIRENIEHDIGGFQSRDPSAEAALLAQARTIVQEKKLNIPLPPVSAIGKPAEPFTASPELMALLALVRRSDIEQLTRQLDRMAGQHGDQEHDPLFAGISRVSPPPVVADGVTLGEAIRRFQTDPMRAHLGDTADAKYVMTFRIMKEAIGEHTPLASITRAQCAVVQELISGMPSNVSKLKAYDRCKTIQDIVALAAERKTDKLMSPGTVKVYSHTQAAFFNWGIAKGLVTANPASGMAPKKAAKGKRRSYKTAQINTVLAALPEWSEQGALAGRYWLFLIGIFSGMRLGEIATLTVDDIITEAGVPFFQLMETDDRGLKTPGSERIIPVHPTLIELGLLQRVAKQRKAGVSRLFPELPGGTQDQVSDIFSKRFAYLLKAKLKLKDEEKGLTFHSTRHTFRDAMRNQGFPQDVVQALGGWKAKSVDERYGDGLRPDVLVDWMNKINYKGLVLPPAIETEAPLIKVRKSAQTSP